MVGAVAAALSPPPCHLLCSKGVVVPSFSSTSSLEDAVPLDDSLWSLNSPVQGEPTEQSITCKAASLLRAHPIPSNPTQSHWRLGSARSFTTVFSQGR